MQIKLLLKEEDIPTLTAFSGNIDADSLKPFIYIAQSNDIKRVLGVDLYAKIYADYSANTLTGLYKDIYDNYILDMLVYYSCTNYMAFGGYKTGNNGIFKRSAEGAQIVDYKEVDVLISRYRQLGANVETNFYEYIKTISIPEYTQTTDTNSTKFTNWY